jgi:hypothetical protein
MLKQFTIDEQFICDVHVYKEWGMYEHIPVDQLTPEQVFKIIKGEDRCSSRSNKDHDEFTKLRNQLEELGYIKTERGWWNGDRVLKPFTLNGVEFEIGEQFSSACAMKYHLEFAK